MPIWDYAMWATTGVVLSFAAPHAKRKEKSAPLFLLLSVDLDAVPVW